MQTDYSTPAGVSIINWEDGGGGTRNEQQTGTNDWHAIADCQTPERFFFVGNLFVIFSLSTSSSISTSSSC